MKKFLYFLCFIPHIGYAMSFQNNACPGNAGIVPSTESIEKRLASDSITNTDFDKIYYDKIEEVGMHADINGAQELLHRGMDVNARGPFDHTMLWHSISYLYEDNEIPAEKRLEFMDFLLKNGAELHPNTEKCTQIPILEAVFSKIAPQIIALLQKHGACINYSYKGLTALHLASWNGRLDVVNYLLEQEGIEINGVDAAGMTPLINAAFFGYFKVVQALVNKGAQKDIRDLSGRSALDYAKTCREIGGEWKCGVRTELYLSSPN